jgi:hypothetical protein
MNQRQKIMLTVTIIFMFGFLLVVLFGDNGLFELNRLQYTRQHLLKDNAQTTQKKPADVPQRRPAAERPVLHRKYRPPGTGHGAVR